MIDTLISKLLVIPAIVIGLSFHEYAHASVAIKLGDNTPKMQGRDTLNPLAHIDPIGFICLMLASFGWGKPVQIDPRNFKNPLKDQMLVSLAGPVMNLIIAFVTLIIFNIMGIAGLFDVMSTKMEVFQAIMVYIILINISLFIFNLLPLPNFDGTKILLYFLPNKWKLRLLNLERWSFLILLVIIFTPIPELVITPLLNGVLNGMQWLIDLVIGLLV